MTPSGLQVPHWYGIGEKIGRLEIRRRNLAWQERKDADSEAATSVAEDKSGTSNVKGLQKCLDQQCFCCNPANTTKACENSPEPVLHTRLLKSLKNWGVMLWELHKGLVVLFKPINWRPVQSCTNCNTKNQRHGVPEPKCSMVISGSDLWTYHTLAFTGRKPSPCGISRSNPGDVRWV